MSRFSRVVAPVLGMMLAVSGLKAHAELPTTAIGDNTFIVAKVELAKIDPTTLRTTVKALLGDMAAMAEQGLGEYDKKYKELVDAGAQSFALVMDAADTKNEPEPVIYIGVKAGADINGLKDAVLKDMAAKPAAEQMDVETAGDYLVMHKKGTAIPAGNGARAAEFNTGFADGGDKALVLVFAPNASLRADLKAKLVKDAPPPPFNVVAPLLLESKYAAFGVGLGESPAVVANVLAADDVSAQSMLTEANKGIAQLRTQADAMKAQGGPGAMQGGMMTAIADAIKVSQAGTKFTVNVDLKAVAPTLMQIVPMMMMRGAGSAAPGGAGGQ